MKRLFSRWATNLLAAVSLASLTACASLPDLPRPSRELTFDDSGLLINYKNGLRLFHVQDASTNLVQVDVRYQIGSRDDPEGQAGMAHLVEHLMFEVTPPAAAGQTLKQAHADASLYHNAYTNWDETHYVATGLASEAARMLELEAARLSAVCDDLSEETFLREREVVRNEIRQRVGSRRDALFRQTLAAIYPEGHAYREYIGGDDVQLAAISREDACRFFQRHYVPANATVIVVGNIEGAAVQAVADRVLGPLAREPAPPRREVTTPTLSRGRVEFTADVSRPHVAIAFMVPPRFHEDALAVEMFSELIDSMLHRIVREDAFIADASSVKLGGKRAPALVLSATVRDEADLAKAEKSLWHAVDASLQAVADGAHMNENARQVKRADLLRHVERIDTRGVALADYLEAPRGYGFYQGDLLRLRRLDGTRVYEASRSAFARARALTMVARPAAKDAAEHVRARARFDASSHSTDERSPGLNVADASRPIPYTPARTRAGDVQRYRLENGLKVVLAPYTAMPLVDIRLVFDVGEVDAPNEQPALASLVADAIQNDTAGEGFQLARGFYLAGGQLFVSVQSETTTFHARGLAIYQDYLLGGLAAQTARGVFEDSDLAKTRKVLRERVSQPSHLTRAPAYRSLRAAAYGASHPYARAQEPTPAQLDALTPGTLRKFKRQHYRADNATLVMTGRFDPAIARAHIEQQFGTVSLDGAIERWNESAASHPNRAITPSDAGPVHLARADPRATQTELAVVLPPVPSLDERYPERLVMVELIDAVVGRVRSQRGASYGVNAYLDGDRGPAAITIRGYVDSARAGEALAELLRQLELVNALGSSDDLKIEFAAARRKVLRRLLAEAGDASSLANQLVFVARHELPDDFFTRLAERVASVSIEDVTTLIAEEVTVERARTLLIGPRAVVTAAYVDVGFDDVRWVQEP